VSLRENWNTTDLLYAITLDCETMGTVRQMVHRPALDRRAHRVPAPGAGVCAGAVLVEAWAMISDDRKAKIIVAAAWDSADPSVTQPSIIFENEAERDLYKCCLVTVKYYLKKRREVETS